LELPTVRSSALESSSLFDRTAEDDSVMGKRFDSESLAESHLYSA
jgi:hypothetical protein